VENKGRGRKWLCPPRRTTVGVAFEGAPIRDRARIAVPRPARPNTPNIAARNAAAAKLGEEMDAASKADAVPARTSRPRARAGRSCRRGGSVMPRTRSTSRPPPYPVFFLG